MFYRENGQFKTNYKEDQQIFPITQDRVGVLLLIAFAFIGVPLLADEYMMRAILIPFLILSLAALGVNILVGYCGQISLGSGAAGKDKATRITKEIGIINLPNPGVAISIPSTADKTEIAGVITDSPSSMHAPNMPKIIKKK